MVGRTFDRRPGLSVTATTSAPLLQLDAVSVLRGDRRILDGVSLRLDLRDHTVILGRNGSGKSTLVKLIAHQLYPLGGAGVQVFGQTHWDDFELRKRIGIVSSTLQMEFASDEPVTALDAVLSGFFASRGVWRHHRITADMRDHARRALERMGVDALADRQMASLSTGEARRVLIARALVHEPHALLLDEPCSGLDPATRRRFLNSLREVARSGVTLILITHHIEEILPEISRVVMIEDGRILADGPRSDVLTDARISELFGMRGRLEQDGDWLRLRLVET